MKTKLRSADTATNNGLALPDGFITLDNEAKGLRLHLDGIPGGYQVLGERAVPFIAGPGPEELIGGTMEAGFFGEVTSADLMSYNQLATMVGISAGTAQFNAESIWLKFALDYKVLYVAKKTCRRSISWNVINSAGCVYGQTEIDVGAHRLAVTLIRGSSSDPTDGAVGYGPSSNVGSEWDKLLYPVHSGIQSTDVRNLEDPNNPFNQWAAYSDNDLVVNTENGSWTWCQETTTSGSARIRGNRGITHTGTNGKSAGVSSYGWRPVLRLLP